MAFPASPSNNQVHKEGNRAFVYDSALGVWDQVRETDRTDNKILQGEIGSGVTFPAGHVINQWGVHKATPGSPSFSPSATPAAIDYGSSNGGKVEVTGITATQGNILCIFASPGDIQTTNTGTYAIGTGFKIDGTNYINSSIQNANVHTYGIKFPLSLSFRHTVPSGFTNKTISAIAVKQSGGGTLQIVATAINAMLYYVSMTIFEIQQ